MSEQLHNFVVYGNNDEEFHFHPADIEHLTSAENALKKTHQYTAAERVKAVRDYLTSLSIEHNSEQTNPVHAPTFGANAVGLTFNPSASPAVDDCKRTFAAAIDQMNNLRTTSDNPEVKRMCAIAITDAQTAQMWAVKAITWRG